MATNPTAKNKPPDDRWRYSSSVEGQPQLPVLERKRFTRGGYSNSENVLIAEVEVGANLSTIVSIKWSASHIVSPHHLPATFDAR
jgi:hypothetical protein